MTCFASRTLGFRGEALASIAEVSRMVLRSRTADEPPRRRARNHRRPARRCGAVRRAPGTSVEVHQLFFNTPVRRKFLRATQTEMGHTTEAFTRLALAYPRVHFTLRHGGRTVYDLPPTDDLVHAHRRLLRRGTGARSACGSKATTPACDCSATSRGPAKAAATRECSTCSSTADRSAIAHWRMRWVRRIAACCSPAAIRFASCKS